MNEKTWNKYVPRPLKIIHVEQITSSGDVIFKKKKWRTFNFIEDLRFLLFRLGLIFP